MRVHRSDLPTLVGIVCAVLAPIVVSAILSDSFLLQTFEDDSRRLGLERLDNVRILTERVGQTLHGFGLGLSEDSRLTLLEENPRLEDLVSRPQALFELWSVQNLLAERARSNDLVEGIRVWPEGADYLVDSVRGTVRFGAAITSPAAEGWDTNSLMYTYPLSRFVSKVRGRIEIFVSGSKLLALAQSAEEGHLAIVSRTGSVLATSGGPDVLPISPGATTARGASLVQRATGRVLVAWLGNPGFAWTLEGEFPLRALGQALEARRAWILDLSILLVVLVGGLVAVGARPLWRRLKGARSHETETWLQKALEGLDTPPPADLPFAHFRCATVHFRGVSGGPDAASRAKRLRWMNEMARRWDTPTSRGFLYVHGDGLPVLVINSAEPEGEAVRRASDAISRWEAEPAGGPVSFCWGDSLTGGALGVAASWRQAVMLEEQRFLSGWGCYFAEDLPQEAEDRPLSGEQVHRLVVGLDSGLVSGVDDALAKVAQHLRQYTRVGHGQARLALDLLAATLVAWMSENGINPVAILGPKTYVQQELARQETLDDAMAWLSELSRRLMATMAERETEASRSVDRVLNYLRDHLLEDCGVADVARGVGLSYSHVRKIFQERMGEPIGSYMNRLRIEEAKYLLRQTDLSLAAIAERVGYRNTQSLRRFFRRFGGPSPLAFRERVRAVVN